jgi:hypothetical protein
MNACQVQVEIEIHKYKNTYTHTNLIPSFNARTIKGLAARFNRSGVKQDPLTSSGPLIVEVPSLIAYDICRIISERGDSFLVNSPASE